MSDLRLDIRPVIEADLSQLVDLYLSLAPQEPPTDLNTAKARLTSISAVENSHVFGGWLGDDLVASCTQFVLPNLSCGGKPYALIENVVTDRRFRNRGFGRQILNEAATYAFDQGCYKVMLMTGSSDPKTLDFYRSAGFEQTKTGFQIRNIPARSKS